MKKALSCILSFLPTIIILTCIVILIVFTGLENSGYAIGTVGEIIRILTLLVELAGVGLGVTLVIIYIVKTIKNQNLSVGMKILWCWLLFQMSVFFFVNLPSYMLQLLLLSNYHKSGFLLLLYFGSLLLHTPYMSFFDFLLLHMSPP